MNLSPRKFNGLLSRLGQSFGWRKGYACPCVDPYSKAANMSCPQCTGLGRIWLQAVEGSAGIVGRDQMRNFADMGRWDEGDIMLSIPSNSPLYALGEFDRVVSLNRSEPFSINLTRGSGDVMRQPVLEVERVFWLDPHLAIVEGGIPKVSDDGVMTWEAGEPPEGVTYSITGRRRQEFFVYRDMPADRPLHHGAKLPRRVVLKRFDLYGRS